MKIDYTFHSHTFRCNHAEGDIEDYVSLAIKNGIKIYGVSDHVFLPGVSEPKTRGEYSCLEGYINAFKEAKKKHLNEIEMYLGFECEYASVFEDYYKSLLYKKGFDYLICGQHNGFDENKNYIHLVKNHIRDEIEDLEEYVKEVNNAIRSGLFLYIAHPDLLFISAKEVTPELERLSDEIIKCAIENNAVFEINIHGLYRQEKNAPYGNIGYPASYFWKKVAKTNIRVVYGGDYHFLWEVGDKHLEEKLNDFIKECNIKLSDIKEIYKEYRERIKK